MGMFYYVENCLSLKTSLLIESKLELKNIEKFLGKKHQIKNPAKIKIQNT